MMSVPILSTKLHIPHTRIHGVSRPRLTEKLRTGVTHPGNFVLLSGPAGFGKTTLLSEFAALPQQPPIAWVSLDEADNDPIRFWTYLIAACQTIHSEIGETVLALLQTPQFLPDETIPTLLINKLAILEKDLVLVLDDYHLIHNPSIHIAVSFLLDHLPDNLHMNINAIQQGTRDPLLVFGNDSRRTPTGFLWVIEPSTWAGIHTIGHIFHAL